MSKRTNPNIKNYILKCISEGKEGFVMKVAETFDISSSTVYNYIKAMKNEGLIKKSEEGKYRLVGIEHKFFYELSENTHLSEDRIYNSDFEPLFSNLPSNLRHAWRYSVTEMLNNALEHSQAKSIFCKVITTPIDTTVYILDDGIGIFENIKRYLLQKEGIEYSHSECASVLLVGKFTTARERHSGEGIFFTSHLMDKFVIYSQGTAFSRTNWEDLQLDMQEVSGTYVQMSLSNESKKTTTEIFTRFSGSEDDFLKTHIPISNMYHGIDPVSRSEARRLGELISEFREVTLDFSNVSEIGQAFAHELFSIWQKKHPEIVLRTENAVKEVEFMINRAKKS